MPFGFQPDIVIFPVEVCFSQNILVDVLSPIGSPAMVWLSLAVLCVEIKRIGGQLIGKLSIVDVVIKRVHLTFAFIRYGDAGMALKGHRKERVQGFVTAHGEHFRLPVFILTKAEAEEVADGCFHTGRWLAVPINAENEALKMIGFGRSNREPDMRYDARPINVENGLSRS